MDGNNKDPIKSATDRSETLSGQGCFFSEEDFQRVMGPGPCLLERLHAIASRPKTEEIRKKIKVDIDRSIFTSLPNVKKEKLTRKFVGMNKDYSSCENHNYIENTPESGKQEFNKSDNQTVIQETKSPSVGDGLDKMTTVMEVSELSSTVDVNNGQSQKEIDIGNIDYSKKVDRDIIDCSNQNEAFQTNKLNQDCEIDGETLLEAPQKLSADENLSTTTNPDEQMADPKVVQGDTVNELCLPSSPKIELEQNMSAVQNKDEDVCCLVMPNPSDEDSDDEDGKETEEPFCLIMPNTSSDEQSGKEDPVDFYRRHMLHPSKNTSVISTGISSTKPVAEFKFKSPNAPVAVLPNSKGSFILSDPNQRNNLPKDSMKTVDNIAVNILPASETNYSGNSAASETETIITASINEFPGGETKTITDTAINVVPSGAAQYKEIVNTVTDKPHAGNNVQLRKDQESISIPAAQKDEETPKETGKIFQNVRSKLSKKQHKRYIQLYKRHVCPMMKGNKKAVYTEAELRELSELEELQVLVSQEQVEYQDYLKSKAVRNPNSYNFLTNAARVYSHTRYNSHHRPRNYIKNYELDSEFNIPLVLEDKSASCFMTFQKTLLKLGNSPRITIPDIKNGQNPVQIRTEPSAINAWFPSSKMNYANNTKCMDHKMISEDTNAVKLAQEEEIDIVLSSSSFKCLLDNHASNIMKAWDIPVTVKCNPYGGSRCNTVYLDKPLYRDDFLMREYNTMYHKYALRTLVSRPRDKGLTRIQSNRSKRQPKMAARLENRFSSDDLDMFSTDALEDIDTFGSFSSTKSKPLCFDKSPGNKESRGTGDSFTGDDENKVENIAQSHVRRYTRQSHIDNVPADNKSLASKTIENPSSVAKDTHTTTQTSEEQQNDTTNLRRSTRLSVSLEPKSGINPPCAQIQDSETGPPTKIAKVDTATDKISYADSHDEQPKRKRGRPRKDTLVDSSPSASEQDSGAKIVKQPMSPTFNLTVETESPASPPMPEIHSPSGDFKVEEEHPTQPIEVPLIPIRNTFFPSQGKNVPSLLDSILGPSDKNPHTSNWQQNVDNDDDIENPEGFLPLTERCNHVIYNQWEMGSMKLMIRCNYHGAIKDKGKPRYVYLSPKLEYQSDFGMEQVTLNEMTRTWASCFIRPGTSLVRARINAFSSELLMVEEKTIDCILNSSLPFKPDHSFAMLKQIFERLKRLPEGQYLLSHLKGDKVCKVRKFNGKAGLLPGPKKKRSGKAKEGQVPWIPIDPTILTPSHIHNARIPATFMPCDWTMPVNKNPQGKGNKQQNQGQKRWNGQNKKNSGRWNKPQ